MDQFSRSNLIILSAILATFLIKGMFFASLFPFFHTPDEKVHYSTVQYYALPTDQRTEIRDFSDDTPKEQQHKRDNDEIKSVIALTNANEYVGNPNSTPAFLTGKMGSGEKKILDTPWDRVFPEYPSVTDYPPFYYFSAALIEKAFGNQNFFVRFYSVRLFSVFIGMLVVLLGYLIARTIGFSSFLSLLAAALIAFQPMLTMTAVGVNPDIMLIFTFTLFSYGAVRLLRDGSDRTNTAILLMATIGATLTKGPGIVLVAMLGLLATYEFQRRTHITWKSLIITGIASLVILWVALPLDMKDKFIRTEDASAFSSTYQSVIKYLDSRTFDSGRINFTNTSYWGNFGSLAVDFDSSIIDIIVDIELVGVIGLLLFFLVRRPDLPHRKYLIYFIIMMTLLQLAIRFYDWRVFDINGKALISTPGRYFLPNVAIHIITVTTGLCAFFTSERSRVNLLKILLVMLILLNFYAIFHIIIPHYYL